MKNHFWTVIFLLKKILSGKACAECRLCCIFDRYEVWETPVFTQEIRDRISKAVPSAKFIPKDGGYIFRVEEFGPDGLFTCPALTEKGCMLGDDKPFDCRIWPLMLMEKEGQIIIALSPICEKMSSRPPADIMELLSSGVADAIFRRAEEFPGAVRPYREGYQVLLRKVPQENE